MERDGFTYTKSTEVLRNTEEWDAESLGGRFCPRSAEILVNTASIVLVAKASG
jgi:hypothetical protein